jgi:hypothetical protein
MLSPIERVNDTSSDVGAAAMFQQRVGGSNEDSVQTQSGGLSVSLSIRSLMRLGLQLLEPVVDNY